MKTPEEIINEFDPNDEYPSYYHESSIVLMMNEYAKQWVDETSNRLNTTPRWDACIRQIKQDIDAQK